MQKSSGSFATLFKTRLTRALSYRDSPFELQLGGKKVFNSSLPFSGQVEDWSFPLPFKERAIYLECGSSDQINLPDQSIDLVVTDPPFFDNVHYSELADFFLSWQILYPHGLINNQSTTRNIKEVQDTDSNQFSIKLGNVFTECYRVMKDDGLLIFTYHHSHKDGWTSLVEALLGWVFQLLTHIQLNLKCLLLCPKYRRKNPFKLILYLFVRKE